MEFTSEYGISEALRPELPGPGDMIVDFPEGKYKAGEEYPQCYTKPLDSLKNWNNRFFWVDECVFPTVVEWRTNASKDRMPTSGTYSVDAVRVLDTHQMDLFSLIRAPNPAKVKTRSRPRASHELPLLTLTASRVIEMDEPAVATDSSGVPSAIEKSPLDFADEAEASSRETAAPEMPPPEKGVDANAPPKSLRRDHINRPSGSSRGGKSLAAMQLSLNSNVFMSEGIPDDVSDPDPLAFAGAPSSQGVTVAEDPRFENASSPIEVLSPGSVYRPKWGVTNGSLLDTPEACQDLLRLRFEKEAKLLKKSVAQVARREKRIQDRELEIKNLEVRLETEAEMKRAAEGKNAELVRELEDIRAQFSGLQVSNEHLSQQVAALQEQVSGEEKLKAAFEEFKRYEDDRVEKRWVIGHGLRLAMMKCVESLEMRQAFADVVSAGVAKGMSEGLKHGVEHGRSQLGLESIEAYDPEAEDKFVAALQSLKDLKFSLLDQLEGLKDAPMDVIMAALYLESDTGGDAPQYIRDLCPSSSQLSIPVYSECILCSMGVFFIA
nr:hypothetical protein [Tanacetum cinerariifolium]